MSERRYRDWLDTSAKRAHVEYYGEHFSYNERMAMSNATLTPDSDNYILTKNDLSGFIGDVSSSHIPYKSSTEDKLESSPLYTDGTYVFIDSDSLIWNTDAIIAGDNISVSYDASTKKVTISSNPTIGDGQVIINTDGGSGISISSPNSFNLNDTSDTTMTISLDNDLDAIAALGDSSTGYLKKLGINTWALNSATFVNSVGGAANRVAVFSSADVINGDGNFTWDGLELVINGETSISGQITSTLSDGTAPFVLTSTTLVTNLNADLLDGHEWADIPSYTTFTDTVDGLVPNPGGTGNTKYLRQDGTWVVPPTSSGMVYPGAGIALSTGSAWDTSITDNSADWNTAFGWGNWATGVDKTFIDALNIDADTLDGHDSTYFQVAGAYDNYVSWELWMGGAKQADIASSNPFNLEAGTNISLTYSATNNTITIDAASGSSSMVYPDAGIAVSTGAAWDSSIVIGTSTTTYLRNDGTWASPTTGTYDNYQHWTLSGIDSGSLSVSYDITNTKGVNILGQDGVEVTIADATSEYDVYVTGTKATTSALGVVKIGNGISVDAQGEITADAINTTLTGYAKASSYATIDSSFTILTGIEQLDKNMDAYVLVADYNANDILTKLLTVDSDTSGLNANYLQGYTAAGIISDARSGLDNYHGWLFLADNLITGNEVEVTTSQGSGPYVLTISGGDTITTSYDSVNHELTIDSDADNYNNWFLKDSHSVSEAITSLETLIIAGSGLIDTNYSSGTLTISTSANNYVHPSYSGAGATVSGVGIISGITSDTSGHVTSVSTSSLPAATSSALGVVQVGSSLIIDGSGVLDVNQTKIEIKDGLGNVIWTLQLSGSTLLFSNSSGVTMAQLTDAGIFSAYQEVEANNTI